MNKTKKNILVILISLAVTVALVALLLLTKGASNSGPRMAQGTVVPTVKTEVAVVKTLHDYVITNGEVESQSSIEVFPSMSGKIASINVMLGSSVKKGDVIAKVDPSEPGTKFALSPVEAPISGSIVSSPLKIGTKVSTTTAITMIGDIDNLQVSASVPERYIAELKTGLKAEVYLEAYPGAVFTATVSRVSPVVDAATRTKEIILNFDKRDSRINAGMFAKVKLFTSKYEGHIAIPKDAVVEQDENSYLYIVNDDNTVSKRVVRLGKAVDGIIQVVDNVMPGERVVVDGMLAISEGVKVYDISNPVKEDSKEDSQTSGGK